MKRHPSCLNCLALEPYRTTRGAERHRCFLGYRLARPEPRPAEKCPKPMTVRALMRLVRL